MLNRIIISGHLLGDPKFYGGSGGDTAKDRVNFRLAVNQGQGENRTMHPLDVVSFGTGAGNIAARCKKGSYVTVQGRLQASPKKAQSVETNDAGEHWEREMWGVIADNYDGVQFNWPANGNGSGTVVAAAAEEPDF